MVDDEEPLWNVSKQTLLEALKQGLDALTPAKEEFAA
jgi:hypothetical protein